MQGFEYELKEKDGFPVIILKGYLEITAANQLNQVGDSLLKSGKNLILIDFSQCPNINSPGVVGVVDLTYKVVDDYAGVLVITGLTPFQAKVFGLANVFPKALAAPTIDEGITLLKEK